MEERGQIDFLSLLVYIALVVIGFFAIRSAAYVEGAGLFDFGTKYGKQIIWIGASLILVSLVFLLEAKAFQLTAYLIYGILIALLIAVLFLGTKVNGARSWFQLGAFRLQPAEFAKFGTALALAAYLSDIDVNLRNLKDRAIAFIIIFVPMALVVIQGDAGSALVYGALIMVLYREGLPGSFLVVALVAIGLFVLTIATTMIHVAIAIVVIVGFIIAFTYTNKSFLKRILFVTAMLLGYTVAVNFAFENVLEEHQQHRIQVMLGLKEDIKGVGYNVNQSKIAIGSGGMFGTGYLEGSQTKGDFVPEQHTDFIFTTIGEEFGWVGSAIVILLFTTLFLRLIHIAERQKNKFNRVYAYCVMSILFFHFLVNIGMCVNIAPVIGIPLPFLSYGGSSLISFSLLLFYLLRLDANRNNDLDSSYL
jgi:rod shape determining protein RodA